MIETGTDSIGIFKYIRDSPSSDVQHKLLFFASQTVDDRVIVYHLNQQTHKVVVRFCTLPDRSFEVPSSVVSGHATPVVAEDMKVVFPLMPTHEWTLDVKKNKFIDQSGGVLIGMHTVVSGLSAVTSCWAMHQDPCTKGYHYVKTDIPIRNPLIG
jgi:hypothetical protein